VHVLSTNVDWSSTNVERRRQLWQAHSGKQFASKVLGMQSHVCPIMSKDWTQCVRGHAIEHGCVERKLKARMHMISTLTAEIHSASPRISSKTGALRDVRFHLPTPSASISLNTSLLMPSRNCAVSRSGVLTGIHVF
jgi:hypothetical protein